MRTRIARRAALAVLLAGTTFAARPLPALAADDKDDHPPLGPGSTEPPAPAPAPATPPAVDTAVSATTPARPDVGRILLGARIGGLFPEAFNKLDANFLAEIEIAYQLPIRAANLDRRLGLFLDAGYTQPTVSGTRIDPRVTANCAGAACTENWNVKAQDLGFTLGLHYWQPLPKGFLIYGGVGGRLHLVRTTSEAMAGAVPLGVNTEDSTKYGVVARLGGAYHLGPGAIVLEAHMEWTGIDHLITGGERAGESANIGNLSLQAGYMFFIL